MTDYKELVKELRNCGTLPNQNVCEECTYKRTRATEVFGHCFDRIKADAADAIEELLAERDRKWISVKDRLPEINRLVAIVSRKNAALKYRLGRREMLYEKLMWNVEVFGEEVLFWCAIPSTKGLYARVDEEDSTPPKGEEE